MFHAPHIPIPLFAERRISGVEFLGYVCAVCGVTCPSENSSAQTRIALSGSCLEKLTEPSMRSIAQNVESAVSV